MVFGLLSVTQAFGQIEGKTVSGDCASRFDEGRAGFWDLVTERRDALELGYEQPTKNPFCRHFINPGCRLCFRAQQSHHGIGKRPLFPDLS